MSPNTTLKICKILWCATLISHEKHHKNGLKCVEVPQTSPSSSRNCQTAMIYIWTQFRLELAERMHTLDFDVLGDFRCNTKFSWRGVRPMIDIFFSKYGTRSFRCSWNHDSISKYVKTSKHSLNIAKNRWFFILTVPYTLYLSSRELICTYETL